MRIYAAGLTLFCLLTLSGCANVQPSPEVLLTVNGCPRVTQCRLEKSAARTNGDLLTALDEAEAAWAVCADKVDTIIS
ncbi:Rz1-like lysis system protein LysC [Klebsiella pneumoniae]|uniref:Rz1-like lysis system protein LysC n=3 Tax=Klebsiella pneumoniae TaxID=573 RepID=UPI002554E843|nr:Rz1-like lysis system protein LysC [Klebsiella pneumoniae]